MRADTSGQAPAALPRRSWLPALVGFVLIIGVAAALDPRLAPLAGLALVAGPALVLAASRAAGLAIALLAVKPIIDLGWRLSPVSLGGQRANPQALAAVGLLLLVGLAVLLTPRRLVVSPGVSLLLASAALSVALSPSVGGANEFVRFASGVSVFFLVGHDLARERELRRFARLFVAAVSVPVALGFAQKAGWLRYEYMDWIGGRELGRLSGSYAHPLDLVRFLIYAIPFALYLLEGARSRTWRAAYWSFIGLAFVAAAFTYHRTGLLVLGIQLLVWFVLRGQYRRVLLLALLVLLILVWKTDSVMALFHNALVSLTEPVSSRHFLRGRGMIWALFLSSLLAAHPFYWLLGKGGSLARGFVPSYGEIVSTEPHCDYIRILHAYGLLGLGFYLLVLFGFAWRALVLWSSSDRFSCRLGSLMLVVVLGVVVLSITTEPTRYPSACWYLFALGSAVTVRSRNPDGPAACDP